MGFNSSLTTGIRHKMANPNLPSQHADLLTNKSPAVIFLGCLECHVCLKYAAAILIFPMAKDFVAAASTSREPVKLNMALKFQSGARPDIPDFSLKYPDIS
ncbi:hypothetical protein COLO4_19633 [Corchorus olitorius]|uniref:Uncharacterized protein n=1 Tax=Corchorus olitorius TaxID=93759 RepID=A0A1R3J4E9_9ROSI|nr:hypothetical protein COLO4_19633 [Corchorus olitorius]